MQRGQGQKQQLQHRHVHMQQELQQRRQLLLLWEHPCHGCLWCGALMEAGWLQHQLLLLL
jgi:hypothetical protein